MNITLNGQKREIQAATVAALVAELELNTKQVAIERNREIVPRSLYAQTPLSNGDVLEVVAFIGGG